MTEYQCLCAEGMPDRCPCDTAHTSHVAEWLRDRIGELPIQTVVATHVQRAVKDRNRAERPHTVDCVLLDDIWRVIDELAEADRG